MSKAIVISHSGHGQYVVDVVYNTEYLQQLISKLDEEYTRLLINDLPDATVESSSTLSVLQAAQADVDLAIFTYNLTQTDENLQEIQRLTIEAAEKSKAYKIAKRALDAIKTRMDAIRRRLNNLRSNDQERKRDLLWCVDLADGKKDRKLFRPGDEVGVIEISGDADTGQCLLPSYAPGWDYDVNTDGFLANINGLTPFEFLYNWTLLSGWQKWDFRYRSGEIIDGNPDDGWTVRLDNTKSSQQGLEVNTITSGRLLEGIHASYMSCDDYAFGIGDHVIVDITISGAPTATAIDGTIIGFVDNPKPCLVSGFGYWAYGDGGATQEWQHVSHDAGPWQMQHPYVTDLTSTVGGGSDPTIRSWVGKDVDEDASVLEWLTNGSAIYQSGQKIANVPTDETWRVLGAALSPQNKYLYAVMGYSSAGTNVWLCRKDLQNETTDSEDESGGSTINLSCTATATASVNGIINLNDDALLQGYANAEATVSATLSVEREWVKYGPVDLGTDAFNGIGGLFHFNASCSRALSMWDFVHGAKRTPQATPGGGASWHPTVSVYDDFWKEKLEFTIDAPDASTLAKAGITLTNHGRQGYIVKSYHLVTDYTYGSRVDKTTESPREYAYGSTIATTEINSLTGSYQTNIGFFDDTEIGVYLTGSGSDQTESIRNTAVSISGISYHFDVNYSSNRVSDFALNLSVPALEILLPMAIWEVDVTNTGTESEHNENSTFIVTRGIVAAFDYDAFLIAHDAVEYNYSYVNNCTGGSYTAQTDTTLIERGHLYCGALLDESVGDPVVTSTPSSGSDTCGYSPHYAEYTDVYGGTPPPYQVPTTVFGTGLPLHQVTEYAYDLTAGPDVLDDIFSFLTPSIGYENVKGARGINGKYMAYWQNSRTPGDVKEYKAYLTGGDPFTLDTLSDPVIYRGIHAV